MLLSCVSETEQLHSLKHAHGAYMIQGHYLSKPRLALAV